MYVSLSLSRTRTALAPALLLGLRGPSQHPVFDLLGKSCRVDTFLRYKKAERRRPAQALAVFPRDSWGQSSIMAEISSLPAPIF